VAYWRPFYDRPPQVERLGKEFVVERDWRGRPRAVLRAVDDVSFTVAAGGTLTRG
jgi:ABC-type oligopeptide transport system ATPase subunit